MRKNTFETDSQLAAKASCKLTVPLHVGITVVETDSLPVIMSFKEPFHTQLLRTFLIEFGNLQGHSCGATHKRVILQKKKKNKFKIWSQKLTSPSFQSSNMLEQIYSYLFKSWHRNVSFVVTFLFACLGFFVVVDVLFVLFTKAVFLCVALAISELTL